VLLLIVVEVLVHSGKSRVMKIKLAISLVLASLLPSVASADIIKLRASDQIEAVHSVKGAPKNCVVQGPAIIDVRRNTKTVHCERPAHTAYRHHRNNYSVIVVIDGFYPHSNHRRDHHSY
jgi:hypothetical protein